MVPPLFHALLKGLLVFGEEGYGHALSPAPSGPRKVLWTKSVAATVVTSGSVFTRASQGRASARHSSFSCNRPARRGGRL